MLPIWPKAASNSRCTFSPTTAALLSLELKLYPTGAVIQTAMQLENRSQRDLLLDPHINPLFLTLKNPAGGLKPYSSVKGQHGFHLVSGRFRRTERFH